MQMCVQTIQSLSLAQLNHSLMHSISYQEPVASSFESGENRQKETGRVSPT